MASMPGTAPAVRIVLEGAGGGASTVRADGDLRPVVGVAVPAVVLRVDGRAGREAAEVLVDLAARLVDVAVLGLHPIDDADPLRGDAERQATHVALLGKLITAAWKSGGEVNATWEPLMDAVDAIATRGASDVR